MSRILRRYDPVAATPDAPRSLLTRTGRSQLTLRRFRHCPAEGVTTAVATACRDGQVAVFQLRDKPAHEFLLDGRSVGAPLSPRGSLHFVDLAAIPTSLLTGAVDSLHLHIPAAALEDLAEAAGTARPAALRTQDAWHSEDAVLQRMQPLLLAALEAPGGPDSLVTDHLMLALAAHFARAYGGAGPPRQTGGLAPWQARRAQELLAADLQREMSLLEVAQACGLSLAHFSRGFKATTGTTPHGWRQQRRVAQARLLLRQGGLPLQDVALRCGFADQSHFTRIFRRSTGATPGHWRRLQQS